MAVCVCLCHKSYVLAQVGNIIFVKEKKSEQAQHHNTEITCHHTRSKAVATKQQLYYYFPTDCFMSFKVDTVVSDKVAP